jgi:hypothetical protein
MGSLGARTDGVLVSVKEDLSVGMLALELGDAAENVL